MRRMRFVYKWLDPNDHIQSINGLIDSRNYLLSLKEFQTESTYLESESRNWIRIPTALMPQRFIFHFKRTLIILETVISFFNFDGCTFVFLFFRLCYRNTAACLFFSATVIYESCTGGRSQWPFFQNKNQHRAQFICISKPLLPVEFPQYPSRDHRLYIC